VPHLLSLADPAPSIHYAPADNLEPIDLEPIDTAKREIDFAAYVLTDWPVMQALVRRQSRRCEYILTEPSLPSASMRKSSTNSPRRRVLRSATMHQCASKVMKSTGAFCEVVPRISLLQD
jgi:hypothetical protein